MGILAAGWLLCGSDGLAQVRGEPRVVFQVGLSRVDPYATFSSDGKMLAVCSGQNVKVWEVPGGREVAELPGHEENAIAVAFSSDGTTFASRDSERAVRTWRTSPEGWELLDEIERSAPPQPRRYPKTV